MTAWGQRRKFAAPQKVGSHIHFHRCVIDGVFAVDANGQVQFAEAPALTPEDLAAVIRPELQAIVFGVVTA
jgi:hypothetical protein